MKNAYILFWCTCARVRVKILSISAKITFKETNKSVMLAENENIVFSSNVYRIVPVFFLEKHFYFPFYEFLVQFNKSPSKKRSTVKVKNIFP